MTRIALCLILLLPLPVLADSILPNGDFEAGTFTGWSTIGDALVVGSTFGSTPASGNYQAMVTNAPRQITIINGPVQQLGPGESFSGTPAVDAFGVNSPLDAFLGLPANTLNSYGQSIGNGANVTWQGSAMSLTFSGNAGDVISLQWSYLTNESPAWGFSDFAFGVLDGSIFLIEDSQSLISTGSTPYFNYDSGWQMLSITLATSGTHRLSLGIVDGSNDGGVDSALLVDNFAVAAPVPEPSTLALLGIGIALIGILKWKRTL